MREQRQIEVTKIQAKQAVLVAVITAVSSIIGTILATKPVDWPRGYSPSSSSPVDRARVVTAPLIFVASADPGRVGASNQECKDKAISEMRLRRGRIVSSGDSWIAMELRNFGIMVMCKDEVHGASVIVAGGDDDANSELAIAMRAAVLE